LPVRWRLAPQVRKALADHGVIFFRNQTLTPEQHLAFARTFGAINVNRFFKPVAGYLEIAEVRKEPNQKTNIGGGWHTDHSYDSEPALGSVLYAREVPLVGGDTLFSSMYAAYDALSDGLKQTLARLRAVHSSRHVFGIGGRVANTDLGDRIGNPELATQDAIHPVVVTHPDSGRKLLYVNPGFTLRFEGWTDAESQPLLNFLHQHAARPEFGCRWHWEKGSLAVWDNRGLGTWP
jgi:taurine dioxygenase